MIGVYPGTFDPPTIAHLAIAEAAVARAGLVRIDLVLSRSPLGKHAPTVPIEERARLLHDVAAERPWLGVATTDAQLIAEIARGYDVLVVGADKWEQIVDPSWYADDEHERDAAVASLPRVLVVPRAGASPKPPAGVELLDIDERYTSVSSSAVRAGELDLAVPEARELYRNLAGS
jgi:nicotinic acid mononucleotide adenylyltransferase